MAHIYTVRIHEHDEQTRSKVIKFMEKIPGSYVMAREVEATRPHYQGWIRCDLKDQALRKRIKEAFPEAVGNKQYSLTQCRDFEGYQRYILKGTKESLPDVVCFCGMDLNDESIKEVHQMYWELHGKPKKSNRAIVDEVYEYAKTLGCKGEQLEDQVIDRLLGVYAARGKPFTVYQVKAQRNVIMLKLDDSFKDLLKCEIKSRY